MKKQYITPVVYVVHLGTKNGIMQQQQLVVGSATDPQPVSEEENIGWVKEEQPTKHYNVWNDDWREQ